MTDFSRISPAHLAEMVMEAEEMGVTNSTIEDEFYDLLETVDAQTRERIAVARDYWRRHGQQLVVA